MGFPNGTDINLRRYSDVEWQLTCDLVYRGKRDTFTVPAGFRTDFASVPRAAVWLIPKFGRWTLAAIVHDLLCVGLARAHRGGPAPLADARETDRIFARIMRELGVPLLLRWLMWTGVRYGALFNPARRAGWWRDLGRLIPLTLLGIVLVGPPALLISLSLSLYVVGETLAALVIPGERPGSVADAGLTT